MSFDNSFFSILGDYSSSTATQESQKLISFAFGNPGMRSPFSLRRRYNANPTIDK